MFGLLKNLPMRHDHNLNVVRSFLSGIRFRSNWRGSWLPARRGLSRLGLIPRLGRVERRQPPGSRSLCQCPAGSFDLFLGRTDNIDIRFAAAIALLFNVLMVVVAIIAIALTVPRDDPGVGR
jgi:hypothetical protein